MKKQYTPGQPCPYCGTILEYDEGQEQTFYDSPIMPFVYCPNCGLEFEPNYTTQI